MSCLSSAAFLSCSVSAVPLSCRVSRTVFSFWYALQYCNNDISIQTHWLPNVASSFSVSLHVLSLSRRVFIMQHLLPAVSLSCGVSRTIFSYWYAVQYCNNDILLKFTDYLTQLLLSVSHSMSCLPPAALLSCSVSAVPLSCCVSRTLLSF